MFQNTSISHSPNHVSLTDLIQGQKASVELSLVSMLNLKDQSVLARWLVSTKTVLPPVARSWTVRVPQRQEIHKRIQWSNHWNQTRRFGIRSSDPVRMSVRESELRLTAHQSAYIHLTFEAVGPPLGSTSQPVLLFISDEKDDTEECLLLQIEYI